MLLCGWVPVPVHTQSRPSLPCLQPLLQPFRSRNLAISESLKTHSLKQWFSVYIFQLYWGITDKIIRYLKCTMWWFEIHIHYERTLPVEVINISITSIIYPFSLVRTFKFYSLSKFQLYNTVLVTIVIRLYFRSSDLIHLIIESFYPFANLSLLPPPNGSQFRCS